MRLTNVLQVGSRVLASDGNVVGWECLVIGTAEPPPSDVRRSDWYTVVPADYREGESEQVPVLRFHRSELREVEGAARSGEKT